MFFFTREKPDSLLEKAGYVRFKKDNWHRVIEGNKRYHVITLRHSFLKGYECSIHYDFDYHKSAHRFHFCKKEVEKIKKNDFDLDKEVKTKKKLLSDARSKANNPNQKK